MSAMVCYILANANKDPKSTPYELDDFWTGSGRKRSRVLTGEQMLTVGRAFAAGLGAKVMPRAEYEKMKKARQQAERLRRKAAGGR